MTERITLRKGTDRSVPVPKGYQGVYLMVVAPDGTFPGDELIADSTTLHYVLDDSEPDYRAKAEAWDELRALVDQREISVKRLTSNNEMLLRMNRILSRHSPSKETEK